jgi:hypothetical protein
MTNKDGVKAPTTSQSVAGAQSAGAGDRDPSSAAQDARPVEIEFDFIDEALEETMPASDPPALAPETTIGPPDRHDEDRDRDRG